MRVINKQYNHWTVIKRCINIAYISEYCFQSYFLFLPLEIQSESKIIAMSVFITLIVNTCFTVYKKVEINESYAYLTINSGENCTRVFYLQCSK